MNWGVYIHIPFCAVHCTYCDFPLTTRSGLKERYLRALIWEMRQRLSDTQSDTLYFGGGTPSFFPAEWIEKIITAANASLTPDAEVTLEANPDDLNESLLKNYRAAGINRLSIGVQSLDDAVLQASLRQHKAADALDAIHLSRNAGFPNLNVDLMIGLPGQTSENILRDLQTLIGQSPEHFSIYALEIHEGTGLDRQMKMGKAQIMNEDAVVSMYREVCKTLQAAGYLHYEVSNFAREGFESRHNLKYWNGAPYIAFGAGACSYDGRRRINNHRDVTRYIEACEGYILPAAEVIEEDHDTRMRNFLIFGLRKREGIDTNQFEKEFGITPLSLFPEKRAADYLRMGYLELRGPNLALTFEGMLLSNEILSDVI